jgi:hypothetical protein
VTSANAPARPPLRSWGSARRMPVALTIVDVLPNALHQRLASALQAQDTLWRARTVAELDRLLSETTAHLTVIDPMLLPRRDGGTLVAAVLDRYPDVRVVSYTGQAPEGLNAVRPLMARGGRYSHLVLQGIDDAPEDFRALLENLLTTAR